MDIREGLKYFHELSFADLAYCVNMSYLCKVILEVGN